MSVSGIDVRAPRTTLAVLEELNRRRHGDHLVAAHRELGATAGTSTTSAATVLHWLMEQKCLSMTWRGTGNGYGSRYVILPAFADVLQKLRSESDRMPL